MKISQKFIKEIFYCDGWFEGDLKNYILKSDSDINISWEVYEEQIELLKNIYKGVK